jgi:hypothetical protein
MNRYQFPDYLAQTFYALFGVLGFPALVQQQVLLLPTT